MTSSTTLTAATTSAPSRAQPKLSTTNVFSKRSDASLSTIALSSRTRMNPKAIVNGSRNAAITGGSAAFRIATTTATRSAPAVPLTSTPGRIAAATPSAAAVDAHDSSTRTGLNFGRTGSHATASP
jgi:hypothetical protein